MKKFLEYVVDTILLENSITDLHKTTLIVPSQRAKWHLKKHLIKNKKNVFILPEITTIQNFINSKSPLENISNIESNFILYNEAKKLDETLLFKDFQKQSSLLLKSYNDVERNLIDHDQLFNELQNISEIEQWSLNKKNLSKNQEKLIFQFKKIGELFKAFRKKLILEKKGTSGLINRIIAENPDQYLSNEKNIYFLGLNAISKSEEHIIKYLEDKNSKILVDIDNFYVENSDHEAGYFYRKHQSKSYNKPFNNIKESKKNIHIYASNSSNQQIEIARKIIENKEGEYALLLMDESLGPLVYSRLITQNKNINLASGIKNKLFENHQLIQFLLDSASVFKSKKINFLWLENFLSFTPFKSIIDKNKVKNLFISKDSKSYEINILKFQTLHPLINDVFNSLNQIFNSSDNDLSEINLFLSVVEELYKEDPKEQSSIQISKETAERIMSLVKHYNIDLNYQDFIKIFTKEVNRQSIVVSGENDSEIQIIGLLESRLIDYENIIFLSCNEEFLPSKPNSEDLFPEDLKKYFGIPSGFEREAISAYYFYRCFHYAKNINLIYVKAESKGLTSNEPSRYIRQVEKEMGGMKNISIKNFKIKTKNNSTDHQVLNNENIQNNILKWMKKGISPSAIIKYNNCPLDFYFKYVTKIKEIQEPNKFLTASDWGIAIHKTLENLFYENRNITEKEITKIKNELNDVMPSTFNEIFTDNRYSKGKNILIYHHYKRCIENYLEKEIVNIKEFGSYSVLNTEKNISITSSFKINKEVQELKMLGQIDRIDSTSNGIRLVDYKTGIVNPNEISLKDFKQLLKKEKAFQLFFYGLLWNQDQLKNEDISCQIISLKNTFQPHLNLNFNKNILINNDAILNFKKWLIENIEGIYNTSVFSHKNESLYCDLC